MRALHARFVFVYGGGGGGGGGGGAGDVTTFNLHAHICCMRTELLHAGRTHDSLRICACA